jgi:hypothetical protein
MLVLLMVLCLTKPLSILCHAAAAACTPGGGGRELPAGSWWQCVR